VLAKASSNLPETENLKINAFESKLIFNRVRWYGHLIGMNEKEAPR
jgi:hypothetical protein